MTDDDFDLKRHSKDEDVNVITGLLKLYFRELSDPLMTFHLYDHFVNAMRSCPPTTMRTYRAYHLLRYCRLRRAINDAEVSCAQSTA